MTCPALIASSDTLTPAREQRGVAMTATHFYSFKAGTGIRQHNYPDFSSESTIIADAGIEGYPATDGAWLFWVSFDTRFRIYRQAIDGSGSPEELYNADTLTVAQLVYNPFDHLLYFIRRIDEGLHSGIQWYTDSLMSMAIDGSSLSHAYDSDTAAEDDGTHLLVGNHPLALTPDGAVWGISASVPAFPTEYAPWRYAGGTLVFGSYVAGAAPKGIVGTPGNTVALSFNPGGTPSITEVHANLSSNAWACADGMLDSIQGYWSAIAGDFTKITFGSASFFNVYEFMGSAGRIFVGTVVVQ